MPAWRIGELLLYAGRMAARFGSSTVDLTLRYEGLSGRALRSTTAPPGILDGHYSTNVARYERRVALAADDIESGVIEMTDDLVRALFELFEFRLPADLSELEINRMRTNRF